MPSDMRHLPCGGIPYSMSRFDPNATLFGMRCSFRLSMFFQYEGCIYLGGTGDVLLRCAGDDDHGTGAHHVVHAGHGTNADGIDRGLLMSPDDPDDRPHRDVRTRGEVGLLGDDHQPSLAGEAVDDPALGRARDDDADHGTAHRPAE